MAKAKPMRAHLKDLVSPDVNDLRTFQPRDPRNFALVLDAKIGVEGLPEHESFRMLLCTPVWLMENHAPGDVVVGHQLLIVMHYDFQAVAAHLAGYCRRCEGADWPDLVRQLMLLGRWEFDRTAVAQGA